MKISSPKAINWTLKQYGYTSTLAISQQFRVNLENVKNMRKLLIFESQNDDPLSNDPKKYFKICATLDS
jgi:hypothetical protein